LGGQGGLWGGCRAEAGGGWGKVRGRGGGDVFLFCGFGVIVLAVFVVSV